MEWLVLLISASCLLVGVVGNHAAPLPSEIYWQNKLPNTPMPAIVHDLLHPSDEKIKPLIRAAGPPAGSSNLYMRYKPKHKKTISGQSLNFQKYTKPPSQQLNLQKYSKKPPSQQLNLQKYSKKPPSQQLNLQKYSKKPPSQQLNLQKYSKKPPSQQLNLNKYKTKPPSQQLNLQKYSKKPPSQQLSLNKYTTKPPSQQLNLNKYTTKPPSQQLNLQKYSKKPPSQQLNLNKYKTKPPSQELNLQKIDNAARDRQLHSPGASLFFLESDLYPGAKMNLHFVASSAGGTSFLPQKLAEATPFSSNKLPQILNKFAISPKSEEAEIINETIMDCEQPAIKNEEKYCATSLESLVDYGTSKFGKNVNVLTTEIVCDIGKRSSPRKQQYVVSSGVIQIVSDNVVACHSMPYLYAVFYCHSTPAHGTQAHVVPLVGADGTKIKATAVCHKDTTEWDPDHVAFQILKVKPGTVPICHFLTEDTIVWAAKNKGN